MMEDYFLNHGCRILYNHAAESKTNNRISFRAECSPDFNRKKAPHIEHLIEKNWALFKQDLGDKLYNGRKFRINDVKLIGDEVIVEVGLTDYKDHVGTNLGQDVSSFLEFGEASFGNKHACLSDALGVGSMLVTADNYFIFVERSLDVAEGKGKIDFPGGHAEPMEMAKKIGCEEIDLSLIKSEDVLHEIFYSMVREVRDEINIPEDHLSWPVLLGFLRNITNGGKPHAAFIIECRLGKDEIQRLFEKGGPEAYESTRILFVKKEDLLTMSSARFQTELGEMTPCAKATLSLYLNYQTESNGKD